MADLITWSGASGKKYQFEIYPIPTEFNSVSGVYIFCRHVSSVTWEALYVGETESFKNRIDTGLMNHDGFKRASNIGATHVAVMLAGDNANRLSIETDLRHGIDPVCNRQRVKTAAEILYGQ